MIRNVLVLKGGGFRGVFSAHFLAMLEIALEQPLYRKFDLIVGTSTGGIITLAVSIGIPAHVVRDMYTEHGSEIFKRNRLRGILTRWGLMGSKYSNKALRRSCDAVFGDASISDAKTPIMVTAYDMTEPASFFFKSHRAKEDVSRDFTMVDAAMATSAAPTFFDPVELRDMVLIDGGVHSNDPSVPAIVEAMHLYPHDELRVLSIGTGSSGTSVEPGDVSRWGLAFWARHFVPVFIESSDSTAGYISRSLLGDNYMVIDAPFGGKMDDASQVASDKFVGEAHRIWHSHGKKVRAFIA